MINKNKATIWTMLIVLMAMLYVFSAYIFVHTITDVYGIPWLDEITFAILFIISCGLVGFWYKYPELFFTQKADRKRILLLKKIWSATQNFSEESVEDVEKRIDDIFYSI
jgi:hypothetical protein